MEEFKATLETLGTHANRQTELKTNKTHKKQASKQREMISSKSVCDSDPDSQLLLLQD